MERNKIKNKLIISSIVWTISIIIFFYLLLKLDGVQDVTSSRYEKIMGELIMIVTIGSTAYLFAVGALSRYVENKKKLVRVSASIWILSTIVFTFFFRNFINDTAPIKDVTYIISLIMIGLASFVLMCSGIDRLREEKQKKAENERSEELKNRDISTKTPSGSLADKISSGLDDIVFKPKRKSHVGILITIFLLIFGFLIYLLFFQRTPSISQPPPSNSASVNRLSLTKSELINIGNTTHFQGTIKNDNLTPAVNVSLRMNFSKQKESTDFFDTRYFTVPSVAQNGAYSFDFPFILNYTGQYWWGVYIEGADFQ